MQHYIKNITSLLISRLPSDRVHYTPADLAETGYPDYLVNRVRLELEKNLAESVKLPDSDWADMKADPVEDAWDHFLIAIRAETRIPSSYIQSVTENAVEDVLELFTEPRRAILETLFRGSQICQLEEIQVRRKWIVVNSILADAVIRYIERKNLTEISREQAAYVISETDRILCSGFTPLKWAQHLDRWFDLMENQMPGILMTRFFLDKGMKAVARQFEKGPDRLSRNHLIEVLSTTDFDFEESEATEPEVTQIEPVHTEAGIPAEEKEFITKPRTNDTTDTQEPGTGDPTEDSSNVETINTIADKFIGADTTSEDDQYNDPADDGPTLSEPEDEYLQDETYSVPDVEEESDMVKSISELYATDSDNENDTTEIPFEFDSEEDVTAIEVESGPESENAEPEYHEPEHEKPPFQSAPDKITLNDTEADEETGQSGQETHEVPIWQRFVSEENDEEVDNEEIDDEEDQASPPLATSQIEEEIDEDVTIADLASIEYSDTSMSSIISPAETVEEPEDDENVIYLSVEAKELLNFLEPNKDAFVDEIFNSDERSFYTHISEITTYNNWWTAGKYITRDIFDRNRVDLYSDHAVLFTDAVQEYFSQREINQDN